MNRLKFMMDYVTPYQGLHHIHDETGFIVWRRATGGNVELLHLKVEQPGHGHGKRLLLGMIRELRKTPPYETVFGFTRSINDDAQSFYARMGFTLSRVTGVYRDGEAILFSQRYQDLCGLADRLQPSPQTALPDSLPGGKE